MIKTKFYTCLKAILFISFISSNAFAKNISTYQSHWGINTGYFLLENIPKGTNNEVLVEDEAPGLGFFYTGEITHNTQVTAGIDLVFIKDNQPFSSKVKNSVTGSVSNKESTILGKSLYLEYGIQYPFLKQNELVLGISGGFRYNNVDREIIRCDNCQKQDLDSFESSAYIKPYIGYHFTEHLSFRFTYSNYLNKNGFSDSIGIEFMFFGF